MVLHPDEQSECMLPFPTFLTSDDCRTVADDIYQKKHCVAFLQQSMCLLPLPIFLAGGDGRIAVDDVLTTMGARTHEEFLPTEQL